MDIPTNAGLHRFTHTFNELVEERDVKEISESAHDGEYKVRLEEDAEHQDIGIVVGVSFLKAGYALVGVHQHYTSGDSIDQYTFTEVDSIDSRHIPDSFMNGLHYDEQSGSFKSEYGIHE